MVTFDVYRCMPLNLRNASAFKDRQDIKAIEVAALLHDMGKLAIPSTF